jgi:predicted GIY-YIG superfamily endonuclease
MPTCTKAAIFTFVMASRRGTLYVGVNGNLQKRVFEHKMKGARRLHSALQL